MLQRVTTVVLSAYDHTDSNMCGTIGCAPYDAGAINLTVTSPKGSVALLRVSLDDLDDFLVEARKQCGEAGFA